MVAVLGSDGPASVRAPLAAACAEFDPATAARLRAGLEREAAVRAAGPGEDTPAAWLAGEDDYVDLADDEEAPQESPTGPSPPGPAHPPAHRAPPLPDPGPGGAATRPADSLAQAGDDASRAVTDPGGMDLSSIPVPGDSGDVDGLEDTDVRIRDRPSRLGAHADASVATGGTVLGWRPSDEPDSAPRTQPPASRSTPRFRKLDVTRAKLVFIDGGVLQFHTGAELAADGVGSVAFGRVKTRSGHILILDLVTNWRRRQRSDSLQVVRLESRSTDAREVFGNPELDPTEAFARLARTIATLGHARMLPDAWAVPSAPIQDFASLAEFEATYARLGA